MYFKGFVVQGNCVFGFAVDIALLLDILMLEYGYQLQHFFLGFDMIV